jgi:hypothetical protein
VSSAEFLLRIVGIVLAFGLVAAICVRFFARTLSFPQAFTISLAAYAVTVALFIAYTEIKRRIAVPSWLDPISYLGLVVIPAVLINWLVRKRGIEKAGCLGVGGKTALSVGAINWVLIGIFVTGRKFL